MAIRPVDGHDRARVALTPMHAATSSKYRPIAFGTFAQIVMDGGTDPQSPGRPPGRTRHSTWPSHLDGIEVSGATHHSGRVRPGDAFFALPGATGHGIEHAEAALDAGASIVVSDVPHSRGITVEDPAAALLRLGGWARSRLRRPVVGVTGSAGKTTAKALVAAALDAAVSPGNLNTAWALAGILTHHYATGGDRPLVLEMGIDRVGEMDELVDLVRPDVGMLVLVGPAHLDAFGDLHGVAREKARLIARSPRRVVSRQAASYLSPALRGTSVIYGLDATPGGAATSVDDVAVDARGVADGPWNAPSITVTAPWTLTVALPGHGDGTAESTVGALVVADLLGVDVHEACARLEQAQLEAGRLTVHPLGSGYVVDDAYNANPASLRVALDWLARAPRPHVLVLGDMAELGDLTVDAHRHAGIAARAVDRVIVMGRHADVVAEARPGAIVVRDDAAMVQALDDLPPGATILIKASRSAGFERFVRHLLDTRGSAR